MSEWRVCVNVPILLRQARKQVRLEYSEDPLWLEVVTVMRSVDLTYCCPAINNESLRTTDRDLSPVIHT